MKRAFVYLGCGVLLAGAAVARAQFAEPIRGGGGKTGTPLWAPTKDRRLPTFAHGVFVGPGGKPIPVTKPYIEEAQRQIIGRLAPSAPELGKVGKIIRSLVADPIVANALYLDHLIDAASPADRNDLVNLNHAFRWTYLLEIRRDAPPKKGAPWGRGVDDETARALERRGIKVFLLTNQGGEAYRDECRKAGVPVPNAMYSNEWTLRGEVTNEFLPGYYSELWSYSSTSPRGICLALPRYSGAGGDRAELLGIICLGTDTSKACFFDNPRGTKFKRNEEVSLSEFVGGVDLVPNGQGTCTDCHAGENPFVVHPLQPPFSAVLSQLQPLAWHDPLVDASWPQNPGPTVLLDAVSSPGRCDSCHRVGSAGRFPEVSMLGAYCSVVLDQAVGPAPPGTMPPGLDPSLFTAHADALKAACDGPPSVGVDVPFDGRDDPTFVSPPMVIDPLYQCATMVAVRGAQLDAEVTLYVNGAAVGTALARNPASVDFNVPALVAGDVVHADQKVDGVLSGPSDTVTVRDHTIDYPAGLPAPQIDPTLIHECAGSIAVRHVAGARITVYSNGADPTTRATSTDWSVAYPAKRPFDVGDTFVAEISLCEDKSPPSAPQTVVAEPASIPAPSFNPASAFEGQELVTLETLVNGATTQVSEVSFGLLGSIYSWPVSWFPNFDVATPLGRPLLAGERLHAFQGLCSKGPEVETPRTVPCKELPPPRIAHPLVGQTFVVVTEAVPGARIRVYDASSIEIGDGAGTVVMLSRPITGTDTLTVVQQVGACTSQKGYRVSVRNPGSNNKD